VTKIHFADVRHESFLSTDDNQYYEPPPSGSAHTRVTEHAVERALLSQSVKKAPGPNKLSFSATQRHWKRDKERIVGLTKAAIVTERQPAVWTPARGLVIRKPGKDNYTQLKAYRSITLLSCLGKVVQKAVTELLLDVAKRRGLLGDRQFGSRRWRSAIDAAAIMVDRAHADWTKAHITGVLLMDINAAFWSVAKGTLVNLMKVSQMDGELIRWTESCVRKRPVVITIERNAVESHPLEAVVTQGSPESPILFAIYTAGLIKCVGQCISESEWLTIVNDLGCVATGRDVIQVVTIRKRYAANSIMWASRWGLQLDMAKTEAALFTRRGGNSKHLCL
jgi:hypothetical protein